MGGLTGFPHPAYLNIPKILIQAVNLINYLKTNAKFPG